MPLEKQFMAQNIDLLNRIEAIAKSIDENIALTGEIQLEQMSTLEKIFGGGVGSPEGKEEGGILASMSKLTMSVDRLSDIIKNKATVEGGAEGGAEGVAGGNIATLKELGKIGGNVGQFAKSLADSVPFFAIARPFMGLITGTIAKFIVDITKRVELEDAEKAKTVGEMMITIGKGILGFASKMALAAPLLAVAVPGLLILKLTSGLITSIASTFAANEDNIRSATGTINRISLSLVGFAGSIAVSALIMSSLGTEDAGPLAILFGGVALATFAFTLMGRQDNEIGKGALALLAMSGSIAIFALAYSFAATSISDIGFAGLGMTLLALVGVGSAFLLAGQFWDKIALGALAFGLAGLSLFLLAPNIETMAETLSEYPHALWQIPTMLLGLGTVMALAGIPPVPGFIALGALALGLAGGALWVIGKGVGAFMDAIKGADEDTGGIIENTLKGVISGFGKGFSDLSVAEALTLPLKIPMVALMGGSLALLGTGLGKYKRVADGWDEEDTETLSMTLEGLSRSFALAGSTDGMTKVFGFPIGSNDTERGIDATMRMGKNLKRLADGISSWKELALSQEEIQMITDNISRVMNMIPAIFADIGARERQSSNQMEVFGVKFGVPFTSTDTELGIEATMRIGQNLKNLADGVLAWKEMPLTPEDIQVITNNVSRVLNSIPAVFATIGAREKGTTGKMSFFGLSFNNPFSSGDIEAGIEATEDLGMTLKNLAEGVLAWKTGGKAGFSPKLIPQIKSNIEAILNVIPKVFSDIGKKEKETEGFWFWQEGDMEKGIELVSGIADPLKSIAALMNSFKDIDDPYIHGTRVGIGIKNMLKSLSEGIMGIEDSEVARLERLMKPLKRLPGIFKDVNEEVKKHIEFLGNVPIGYIENFDKWASGLERISEVNTASLQKNFESSRRIDQISPVQPAMISPMREEAETTRATRIKPKPKDTPDVIVNRERTRDKQDMAIQQLVKSLDQLISVNGSQNAELQAIKQQLQTGIRVTDANPLG